jgi:hypothetical protein
MSQTIGQDGPEESQLYPMIQGRQKVKKNKWPKIMPKILKRAKRAKRAKMDQNEGQNGTKGTKRGSRAQTGQEPKELKWPNRLILPKRGKLL